jgi:Ca2+-transporting ATPase
MSTKSLLKVYHLLLALAFAMKQITYENLLVCVLGSCETMANASVICTDKTGTLTMP